MSEPSLPQTPLARYLARHPDLTQAELARRLGAVLGVAPSSASVAAWTHGLYAPRPAVQAALRKVTRGAVKPEAWTLWAVRRARARS